MSLLSPNDVTEALDVLLNVQMTGQARILAHLVAAAEEHGLPPSEIIMIFRKIVEKTVLDELWVTDSDGAVYLTAASDDDGNPIEFTFSGDADTQPQASAFYPLLSASTDGDACVTQVAQKREIDWNVVKYVGVSGIDHPRIVQVGHAVTSGEQGLLNERHALKVIYEEIEVRSSSDALHLGEVQSVLDAVLSRQMAAQAVLMDIFLSITEAAGWPDAKTNRHLRRIVRSTSVAEITIATTGGQVILSSSASHGKLRNAEFLPAVNADSICIVDHPPVMSDQERPVAKTVTVYGKELAGIIQITTFLDDSELVSPRFKISDQRR